MTNDIKSYIANKCSAFYNFNSNLFICNNILVYFQNRKIKRKNSFTTFTDKNND